MPMRRELEADGASVYKQRKDMKGRTDEATHGKLESWSKLISASLFQGFHGAFTTGVRFEIPVVDFVPDKADFWGRRFVFTLPFPSLEDEMVVVRIL